jgi:hypothetical protein
MSSTQVVHRLRKASIRRGDYRSGRGPEARTILNGVYGGVQRAVKRRQT